MPKKSVILIVLAVIAYVVLTVVLAAQNASIIVSAMASVALVIVTAGLVLATLAYTEAASKQAEAMNRQALAQEEQAKAAEFQVTALAEQVKAADRQVTALAEQVKAADRQVTALTDPVVFFGEEEFESSTISQLFIQNVGPGIAYDLSFKVIKDFEQAILVFNQRLSDLAFIKNPIKTLAPGKKIPFAVLDNSKSLLKETLEVEVSYKNKPDAKEPFNQVFSIDFAYQEGMRQVRRSVFEQLRKIADGIAELKKP
jgi:GH24 family phage-related lysozyme (muramidase)